ncbi:uncharacterized protein LOC109113584 [Cyprinus carpio]|uniref:Uncharacterized protein LOC109113584 n=1 Tax=Cyprinus carpio TaxID=7962 RepID=A0A9Q9XJP6_CYPCA|nr:uncharacterized protein LOC109113584 [Cyprinus carpio]
MQGNTPEDNLGQNKPLEEMESAATEVKEGRVYKRSNCKDRNIDKLKPPKIHKDKRERESYVVQNGLNLKGPGGTTRRDATSSSYPCNLQAGMLDVQSGKISKQVIDCIAGETLTISLAGLKQSDATLRFYSNYSSITLVENGVPVGRNHTDYINRLKVTSESIKVLNVSASDKGRYKLTDHKGRLVSHKAMILVDQHKFAPNKRLIALLLLVIPVGICFCCRKRICKSCQTTKSNTHTNESNTTPVSIAYSNTVTAPVGPGDPGQGYIAGYPPHPDQGQIHYPYPPESSGQPYVPHNPGFHPESVPQNPVYPPKLWTWASPSSAAPVERPSNPVQPICTCELYASKEQRSPWA